MRFARLCRLMAWRVNSTSFGLSSTRRISTMFSVMSDVSVERKGKRRALVDGRLGPDAPAVAMDDALHNWQAHARPVVLVGAVQALEHPEEFADVLHIKAYAVVLDKIDALATGLAAADFDHRHLPLARKLEGVGAQIDQDLLEQDRIGLTQGQVADRDV